MSQAVDLIIYNAHQLCTMPTHDNGPQRGHRLGDVGLIEDGAVAIHDGIIEAIGTSDEICGTYYSTTVLDVTNLVMTPGLVDPHTHAIWAGDRAAEFERRIAGATYQELMAEGGGINSTVRQTRAADLATLVDQAKPRLERMMQNGTTTVECKTGYGLETHTELNMLNAIAILDAEMPLDLVPTFLGAHAVPPEYKRDPDVYVDLLVQEMIPAVAAWKAEHWPDELFCDVFCEDGAFSVEQSRRILEAGQLGGLGLKIHSDEFEALGGTRLAVELGTTSADHLVATSDEEITLLGQSNTIAVSLPCTPFGLGHHHYSRAKAMLEAGAALAIATDCNPGTAWCESMQFSMALATRYLRLTPAQALACATVNAAFAIGRGGKIGTVAVGKPADLVVWEIDDYRHLGYRFGSNLAKTVVKHGKIVFEQ
ncbi:MAG: imidazolonepropionase [Chloroflexi bacterium]|nr:imidazolonepropionase [Chloroflexota bacterium]